MEEAFTIDYNETLLLSVAGGLFLIQVIYYASLYLRIPRRRKAVEQGDIAFQTDCPPLSVILYAREACEELKRNLPALLAQDYPTFEVIVITDENLSDYAHIPDWVLEKVHAGIMSRTNLSDLLRLSLLAEHGGMWLDATFFCAGSLGEYMDLPIWSIKRPDYLHASVACGMFAGYSLACKEDQRHPFVVARDFFLEYWRNSDRLIDYLLVDYLIVQAQRHDPSIAVAFASIEPNNPRCDDLISILDRPFDQSAWSELLLDTSLFKLTWKQEFSKQTDGGQTYYGKLLEGGLS